MVPFLRNGLLDLPGLVHGFFGREGGVSEGDFTSLNVSEAGGDDAIHVADNRARAAAALGFHASALCILRQVHSSDVVTLGEAPDPGTRIEADAMVTREPGLLLGILTADCAPVLLADPEARVIGAAHAGWKVATGGIAPKTIAAMEALGARRERIVAVIGPAISGRNYEIGPDLAAEIARLHRPAKAHISVPEGGKREHFDIPGLLQAQLGAAGIADFADVGHCTYAEPGRWFSHRFATHHGTRAGRQVALIGLA
jgi:YfiH family protein